jgi:D-aspartate ligase
VTSATPLTVLRHAHPKSDGGRDSAACRTNDASEAGPDLSLSVHAEFDAVESEWRRFEQIADCTPFQTFDWLAAWQRHIGLPDGVRPVIAIARFADGAIAFMLPLAVETRSVARRLCWLGQDLNDYNAPLLARDFSQRVSFDRFLAAWDELRALMQSETASRHDWIELEKMPQTIGGQNNPFCHLAVAANPSGAHYTLLDGDWKKFYSAKRSSATRRRDRAKHKHLSEFGAVSFMTSADAGDARRTLEILIDQKSRLFAHKGIADMFGRPGWREFFLDVATNLGVHVSRVQIGATCAAANLGIVFGDTYYHMLASYDDGELSRYGPGALHLRELLAYAIGRGLRRFDFTIGDEPYKLEWSDVHIKLFDYTAAATWRGWPARCRSSVRRPIKRYIKQTPWTWRAASYLRSALGPLLHRPASPPQQARHIAPRISSSRPPVACVMGDMDLLRPIASSGIRCAVVSRPGVPSQYSRFAQSRLHWKDFSANAEGLVGHLMRFGNAQPEQPVLFYEEDAQLLLVSRFREQLAQVFRFVIADAPLVEALVDKAQFQILAERHGLPVPAACRFHPAALDPGKLDLRFPIVLKPLTRLARWNESAGLHKALAAENPDALRALWPRLLELDVDLLAQELIPGAEAQIESYHCYIDRRGSIAGEFTGRKIRTHPQAFGHTTSLEITDQADVQRQGRAVAERLGLLGVAKFDFKRDAAGKLHLLEINPRFTLWHHAGALAGVNIPALVFADLTGTPRPHAVRARAGVRWCRIWTDFLAARAEGVSLAQWLPWVLRCEAKSSVCWDDPMPLVRSALHRLTAQHSARGSSRSPSGHGWAGS